MSGPLRAHPSRRELDDAARRGSMYATPLLPLRSPNVACASSHGIRRCFRSTADFAAIPGVPVVDVPLVRRPIRPSTSGGFIRERRWSRRRHRGWRDLRPALRLPPYSPWPHSPEPFANRHEATLVRQQLDEPGQPGGLKRAKRHERTLRVRGCPRWRLTKLRMSQRVRGQRNQQYVRPSNAQPCIVFP